MEKEVKMTILFDVLYPPDSGTAAYFDRDRNVWCDDYGNEYLDLRDFGFSALQRETILQHIHTHLWDEYMAVPNNDGELVEIYWEYPEG